MDNQKKEALKGFILAMNSSVSNQRQIAYGGSQYTQGTDPKHACLWEEFGYKQNLTYYDFRLMYERQGIAGGVIDMHAQLAFQTLPEIVEGDNDAENRKETPTEKEVRQFAKRTSFFQKYMDATIRRSVGNYSALIIQIADNKTWNEPVDSLSSEQIVKFIPVWEHQLLVNQFDQDQLSPTYSEPLSFTYNEYDFNRTNTQNAGPQRAVTIHADRVIWFGDLYSNGSATLMGNLMLKKGYNDFATMEKLIGAGGEGAYKNSARHIATSFDKDTNITDLAKMFGVTEAELGDVFQEMTSDLNSNFDAGMFGKAATYTVLSTSLPDMRETFDNAAMSAAASVQYPMTVIVGQQTGERASSEDGKVTAKRSTSYRNNVLTPELMDALAKLQKLGLWSGTEFTIVWDSLLDASESEKIDNAYKMAQTNALTGGVGEPIYSQKEIRVVGGQDPEIELTAMEKKLIDEGQTEDPLPEDE